MPSQRNVVVRVKTIDYAVTEHKYPLPKSRSERTELAKEIHDEFQCLGSSGTLCFDNPFTYYRTDHIISISFAIERPNDDGNAWESFVEEEHVMGFLRHTRRKR